MPDGAERGAPDAARLAAHRRLLGMLDGFMVTQALAVVATLGIADLVGDRPVSVAELAGLAGVSPDALYRLLRCLASLEVFRETAPHEFAHTPLSECLRSEVPGSLRYLAMCFGGDHYRAWGEALHAVRTGSPGFDHVAGLPYFDHLEADQEAARVFNRAMANTAAARAVPVLGYDWTGVEGTVADVGGGDGYLLCRLLEAQPHLRGVVVDRPAAVDAALRRIREAGLGDRCTAVEGDFLTDVPPAGTYLLSQILHDWDDEPARRILRTCRRSIAPGGRLVIADAVVPTANEPSRSKLIDLHMLVLLGGRERTEVEWRDLLAAGGFRLSRVLPAPRIDVIEALPAG